MTASKHVRLIRMPYIGERNRPDRSAAPQEIDDAALHEALADFGVHCEASATVELTSDEQKQYGEWQRVALANAHLASLVESTLRESALPVGLLANCNALAGMLAGVQAAVGGGEADVGLVWIDAHADFNTPETTLSGMLGGMPVALASGLCLHRLREIAGLHRPIATGHIVMCGLRDVDPLERNLLDQNGVREVSTAELVEHGPALTEALDALAAQVDTIYVHVDVDAVDATEVPGHHTAVAGGPTSAQLADALSVIFRDDKVVALGIASTPASDLDERGTAKAAAQRLILAAVEARARG